MTNSDDDAQIVDFKADTDADYAEYRKVSIPSGQTCSSFWEVLSSGSHQVAIKWIDPDKGTEDILSSDWLDVLVEGDTEYSFTLSQYPPPNTPPEVSNVTAS